MTNSQIHIREMGDSALYIEVANEISEQSNRKVHLLTTILSHLKGSLIEDMTPSYCGITIYYNPLITATEKLKKAIVKQWSKADAVKRNIEKRTVLIPVCYEGEYAPDIKEVATHNNLSVEQVIKIHSGREYLVHMLGFTPGFPYLGGMDERIATPRRKEPRLNIAAGSVGIAGSQTGIYPIESPGGWQIIGRTTVKLFNPKGENPTIIKAGNYILFDPISEETFQKREQ